MASSPNPYLNDPAPKGRDAIYAAGCAVSVTPLSDTSTALRDAVPIAARAAAAVQPASVSLRWDMGRHTGLRVARFQNWLYEQNREWHFSDEVLCVLWMVEFPDAKCDYASHFDYIDSVRNEYNRTGHKVDDPPTVPCVGYRWVPRADARSAQSQRGMFSKAVGRLLRR